LDDDELWTTSAGQSDFANGAALALGKASYGGVKAPDNRPLVEVAPPMVWTSLTR